MTAIGDRVLTNQMHLLEVSRGARVLDATSSQVCQPVSLLLFLT